MAGINHFRIIRAAFLDLEGIALEQKSGGALQVHSESVKGLIIQLHP